MTLSELLLADLSRFTASYTEIASEPIFKTQKEILLRTESQGRASTLSKIDKLHSQITGPIKFDGSMAEVSFQGEQTSEFSDLLTVVLKELAAWRKGPFNFFGTEVDAEWRADFKFSRLGLGDLTGKKVCDVGAGNGYYLFRLLSLNPEFVFGIDPTDRYLLQYYLLRVLSPKNLPLAFVLDRDSLLESFRGFFDTVLCLGVFYHHPEPKKLLDNLFHSMSSEAELYLETLYFEENSVNFEGTRRYAKMKNIHLIPNVRDLTILLENSGFIGIKTLSMNVVDETEQRTTDWASGDSLVNFLDKERPELTVEGLPRPARIILKASKPKL